MCSVCMVYSVKSTKTGMNSQENGDGLCRVDVVVEVGLAHRT